MQYPHVCFVHLLVLMLDLRHFPSRLPPLHVHLLIYPKHLCNQIFLIVNYRYE